MKAIPDARLWRFALRDPVTPRYEEQDIDVLLRDLGAQRAAGVRVRQGRWARRGRRGRAGPAAAPHGGILVRPSGTEEVTRIYAEAEPRVIVSVREAIRE